jgi:hypothetical protein
MLVDFVVIVFCFVCFWRVGLLQKFLDIMDFVFSLPAFASPRRGEGGVAAVLQNQFENWHG